MSGLYDALIALRDAENPADPVLGDAWRAISDAIDRHHRLDERMHDDVRQRALLKVLRHVTTLSAESPGQAHAWLARVHRSAHIEQLRQAGERLVSRALTQTPKDSGVGWVDGFEAERAPVARDDEAALEQALDRVLDRVHRYLSDRVADPEKRAAGYRRAQIALLANVRGLTVTELSEKLRLGDSVSKAALYKWIERGREQVLIPALEGWDDPVGETLAGLLQEARRADAGKSRPARRKAPVSSASVSSAGADASTREKEREEDRS